MTASNPNKRSQDWILNASFNDNYQILQVLLGGIDTSVSPNVVRALTVDQVGNLTLGKASFKVVHQSDSSYDYYAKAAPGTTLATAAWQAIRIDSDTNVTHADGNANFDNVATTLSSLTYS